MLKGRLGLEHARLPHADRHGLLYLERGALSVEDGCLRFLAAGSDLVVAGDYRIAHQALSLLLLGLHDQPRRLATTGAARHWPLRGRRRRGAVLHRAALDARQFSVGACASKGLG
jgi:CRISP-associated protein Cas1